MPRSNNQKLKLLYIARLLYEQSDEEHPVSMSRIIDYLSANYVIAERKSIYDDIEALRTFGMDVRLRKGTVNGGYYLTSRLFELPELRLLVDSVNFSSFITEKKTAILTKKLLGLCSTAEGRRIRNNVTFYGRTKTTNECIYYNVDTIDKAIAANKKVLFRYFEYTLSKQCRFRRNGKRYCVSPFATINDNGHYYLLAYDSEAAKIKHYRVDRITGIEEADETREGQDVFAQIDLKRFAGSHFSMFSGDERRVSLRFKNNLVGVAIDRFGPEIIIAAANSESFDITTTVAINEKFFGWVFSFGGDVIVTGPPDVVREMRNCMDTVANAMSDIPG